MKTIILLSHTADVRIKVEADTLPELFEGALIGMNNILKEDFCDKKKAFTITKPIRIKSMDLTSLLIDFLSEALTLSYTSKNLFCKMKIKTLNEFHLEAEIIGAIAKSFDEDIKAVTYHEADVHKRNDGKWETIIIFDI